MKDVLETLERWVGEGLRAATATVVRTERSAPRDPARCSPSPSEDEVAGSVTGGCVEPAVYEEAQAVLGGGPPKLRRRTASPTTRRSRSASRAAAPSTSSSTRSTRRSWRRSPRPSEDERPVALTINVDGGSIGEKHLVYGDSARDGEVGEQGARAARARARPGSSRWARRRCSSRRSRRGPKMYVFGAIDFASTLASIGRFLGYHVTVCDARAKFVTPERFPDVDELVVDWPDRFLAVGSGRRANRDLRAHARRRSSTSRS